MQSRQNSEQSGSGKVPGKSLICIPRGIRIARAKTIYTSLTAEKTAVEIFARGET